VISRRFGKDSLAAASSRTNALLLGGFMRKLIAVALALACFAVVGPVGALAAPNPSGTGKPSQSCQELEPSSPGHAESSTGSPFDEPEINSEKGGTGGQNYSENSQYDVACYQASQH
jgi:hypothetical protein